MGSPMFVAEDTLLSAESNLATERAWTEAIVNEMAVRPFRIAGMGRLARNPYVAF